MSQSQANQQRQQQLQQPQQQQGLLGGVLQPLATRWAKQVKD